MTPPNLAFPPEPFSTEELDFVEHFIREQSPVVMRASRMEVVQVAAPEPVATWVEALLPWLESRNLRTQLEAHRQGNALQYLLEKQLMEALTYLNAPSESTRDSFVRGAFKALYACEKFRFGNKAAHHIAHTIETLGLQDYG
jgi:hypothetical protein